MCVQFRTAGFWVVKIAPGHDDDVRELGSLRDLGKGHPVESMHYRQIGHGFNGGLLLGLLIGARRHIRRDAQPSRFGGTAGNQSLFINP
jgi:hypothetical protein